MILRLLLILPFAYQLLLSEIKCAISPISILLPMIAAIIYVNKVVDQLCESYVIFS
jgi:hypothetical protein